MKTIAITDVAFRGTFSCRPELNSPEFHEALINSYYGDEMDMTIDGVVYTWRHNGEETKSWDLALPLSAIAAS